MELFCCWQGDGSQRLSVSSSSLSSAERGQSALCTSSGSAFHISNALHLESSQLTPGVGKPPLDSFHESYQGPQSRALGSHRWRQAGGPLYSAGNKRRNPDRWRAGKRFLGTTTTVLGAGYGLGTFRAFRVLKGLIVFFRFRVRHVASHWEHRASPSG